MPFAHLKTPLLITLTCLWMTGCSTINQDTSTEHPAAGIGDPICWSQLPNWHEDTALQAIPALESQCPRLGKQSEWSNFCEALTNHTPIDEEGIRQLLESHFVPHRINGNNGNNRGLFTGYYEPTLNGSYQRSDRYYYPLYQRPPSMLQLELGSRFPDLKNQRVRGLLKGNKVVPFYDRATIDGAIKPLAGNEILWEDDADAAFFLHIQGSGRVQLPDGTMVAVGYADQNGQPYVAIGKILIERGELTPQEVSLQTINDWLKSHPKEADELKNHNPSYVFFTLRNDVESGPRGSLNVPLTQERSVAVDRRVIPLGTPLWINTTLPDNTPYQRLMVAQDTGGAINGPIRADIFFGRGNRAEKLAGEMKQKGEIYALIPKESSKSAESAECK